MWTIALLVFACCLWGAYFVLTRLMGARLQVAERLESYTEATRASRAPRRWSEGSGSDRLVSRLDLSRHIEDLLDRADLPIKPVEFILIILTLVLGLGAAGWFVGHNSASVLAAGILGVLAPLIWVRLRRLHRQHAFVRQLPDALQAISGSLRAGFGFNQGMAAVASDLPPPISLEFARAIREVNLGLTIEEALQNMAHRMQSIDFDLAVAGILINRQVGGNLAELLDHVTATIRERVKLKNFIRVLTAQQRLSALIIMIVPPVLLVILLTGLREYTSYLLVTRVGQMMLGVAAVMQLLGVFFIRRIVAIDV